MKFVLTVWISMLLFPVFAQKAETIIFNASVHTMNDSFPRAEAVAIAQGKIIKLGTNKEILSIKTKTTRLIDAKGKTLLPGIFDSHLHVIRAGRFYHAELRWDGVSSLSKALTMLKEQAKRTPRGQWVRVVGGWTSHQFAEKRFPTLEEINEATGETPCFILYLYGHAYLNKAGLKALNIDANTPNPAGALIERDILGNPTGLLIAEPNAYLLYSTLAKLPELSLEERTNSTLSFMRELNRLGITSVMDAGGGFQNFPDDYAVMQQLCEQDQLSIRLPYFLFAQKAGKEVEDFGRWINTVEIGQACDDDHNHSNYFVQGGGENLVMSAADFENFDQPRPELSPAMESQLKAVLQLLVKNRWPFRLHATYDESISRFLKVIEEVNEEYPLNGLTWFFDHAETVSEKNLLAIKRLGGGIAIQHRMAYQGESFIRRYGMKAAASTPPVKKMLELGLTVGMGSDGTRVSSYNPFVGLYWLTTGRTVGGTRHMSKENLLDRHTAIKLFTTGSASLAKLDKEYGKIAIGYQADVILLNRDYFSVPDEDILKLSSVLTIVGGKVVYATEEYGSLDSSKIEILPAWSPVKFYGGYQN